MPNILIRNATILSLDETIGVKYGCDILISGDKIAAISPKLPALGMDQVIDATDCLVSPGFVNTHQHCWQQILRGVGADWNLLDAFLQMRQAYGAAFTAEDVYISNYVAALDLINNGVTSVVDHCDIINTPHHADAAVRGLKDAGIRGIFCYGFYRNPIDVIEATNGQDSFNFSRRKADAERVRRQYFSTRNDPADDLVTFGGAPGEIEMQLMQQTVEELQVLRRIGARSIALHIVHGTYGKSSSSNERPQPMETGRTIENMARTGLLGRDLILSHCTKSNVNEFSMLKRMGCVVSTSPEIELQMGLSPPIAFKAKDKGITVGMGIDVTSSISNDFFVSMRMLLQSERARHDAVELSGQSSQRPQKVRKAIEALEMATMGGAKAMQIDHLVGTICLGKRADLIMTRCDSLNMTPFTDPVSCLVFHAHPGNIDTVIVNGRVLKRGGQLVGIDWPYLRQEIRQRTTRIHEVLAEAKRKQGQPDSDSLNKT